MLPIIENCSEVDIPYKEFEMKWKFKCPLAWGDLPTNLDKPRERYCVSCDKSGRIIWIQLLMSVFMCESIEELTHHTRKGHCVAFTPKAVAKRFGDYYAKIPVIDISGVRDFMFCIDMFRAENQVGCLISSSNQKLRILCM